MSIFRNLVGNEQNELGEEQNFKHSSQFDFLDHPHYWVLHLFSTELNRHSHCGVIFIDAYRERC